MRPAFVSLALKTGFNFILNALFVVCCSCALAAPLDTETAAESALNLRRICPTQTATVRYFALPDAQVAGTWQAETPFKMESLSQDGQWVLGVRSFDGKKAWVPHDLVCDLAPPRSVCGAAKTDLFWSNDPQSRSGRTIDEGSAVNHLQTSPNLMSKVNYNGTLYWMWSTYLCPFDPNLHVEPVQATGGQPLAAFLAVLGFAEGTGDNYNYLFGFRTFGSYAGHPRIKVCSGGLCSDAAGRYQILSKTWDTVVQPSKHLGNFNPQSQDSAAEFLMDIRGVKNARAALDYGDFSRAIYKLNLEWASLPGSPYGQPTKNMDQLWQKYSSQL